MAIEHRNALVAGYEFFGYRIESVLGHGGFGITYKATEIEAGRRVAIKEYLPAGFATRDAEDSSVHPVGPDDQEDFDWGLERFGQEAQTLVSFHHPNIVAVHRFFEANNTAYLVMEYERGDSLAAILTRDKTLPENEIREFLYPLLDGLSRVHKAGFMHRDIKPENIFIRTDGAPVLLDFGSARQAVGVRSHSLTSIVSSGYAPFEQYLAEGHQGPWTDIYALGATLYRSVVGRKPPEATARISKDTLIPATKQGAGKYGPELLGAIDAALAVNERERPQDIETFRAILDGRMPGPVEFAATAGNVTVAAKAARQPPPPGGKPTTPPPGGKPTAPPPGGKPTVPPPGGKPPVSMRVVAIVISAFVVVLLASGGGYYLWQEQQESDRIAEEKRQQAERRAAEARRRAEQAKRQRQEAARRRAEQAKRRAEEARRRAEQERRRAAAGGGGEGTGGARGTGGAGGARATGGLIVGRTITSFQVRNRCTFGVKILVRIKDVKANWVTVAWTAIEASRISRAFYTVNRHVYYYGISHDGRTVFNKGNLNNPKKALNWQGRSYNVGHVNMGPKFTRWTVNLC